MNNAGEMTIIDFQAIINKIFNDGDGYYDHLS